MSAITKLPDNPELAAAMREVRRSNAAVPHRNRKKYHRPSAKRDW